MSLHSQLIPTSLNHTRECHHHFPYISLSQVFYSNKNRGNTPKTITVLRSHTNLLSLCWHLAASPVPPGGTCVSGQFPRIPAPTRNSSHLFNVFLYIPHPVLSQDTLTMKPLIISTNPSNNFSVINN